MSSLTRSYREFLDTWSGSILCTLESCARLKVGAVAWGGEELVKKVLVGGGLLRMPLCDVYIKSEKFDEFYATFQKMPFYEAMVATRARQAGRAQETERSGQTEGS